MMSNEHRTPSSTEDTNIVVILHGLNATQRWGFFPEIAQRLRQAGLSPLPIDLVSGIPSVDVDAVHAALVPYPTATVHLVGHSRGGAIAQIVARERDKPAERVVVWAGIGKWVRTPIRVRTPFIVDVESHAERLDITRAAQSLQGRIRYLHAQGDLIVREEEIRTLALQSGNPDALTVFPASTHTFGITDPLTEFTNTFQTAMAHTIDWLTQ